MSATAVSDRAAHSCPVWCQRPPEEHTEELEAWEWHRYHRATLWESSDGRNAVIVNSVTDPNGVLDVEEPPGIDLGDGYMMSADDARAMASALLRAAAEVEALTR